MTKYEMYVFNTYEITGCTLIR